MKILDYATKTTKKQFKDIPHNCGFFIYNNEQYIKICNKPLSVAIETEGEIYIGNTNCINLTQDYPALIDDYTVVTHLTGLSIIEL